MSFTYNPALTTDLAKVRFFIGDMVSGSGPKPDGTNFADDEITGTILLTGSWQKAVGQMLRLLSTLWASQAGSMSAGQLSESSSQADAFRQMADAWDIKAGLLGGAGPWGGAFGFASESVPFFTRRGVVTEAASEIESHL